MKRTLILATVVFGLGSLMLGQNTKWDPKLHPKRKDATSAKDPLGSNGTKRHATIGDVGASPSAKPKSVDAQLKQLEAQDVKQSSPKAGASTSGKSALPAAKTGNKTAGSGMDFQYQAPKGGMKSSNKSSGPGVSGTGVKRRVKNGGR